MWQGFVHLHNVLRWLVLLAAFAAVAGAWFGFIKNRPFEKGDRIRGLLFTIGMDVQLLLGLTLVFKPGIMSILTQPMIGETFPRYVEHMFFMILAVVFVHVGSVLAKRGDDDKKKHKSAAIWYTVALITILVAIPWARPLMPGM